MKIRKIIFIITIELLLAFLFVMFWDQLKEIKILDFFVEHFREIMWY